MIDIDKFYSDADKLLTRASVSGSPAAAKFVPELSRLFLIWTRDYGNIGPAIIDYWSTSYTSALNTDDGKKNAVSWLASAMALLSGSFTEEMNFPDKDWEEIRDIISSEAENMDISLLMSIMSVIVERGKA